MGICHLQRTKLIGLTGVRKSIRGVIKTHHSARFDLSCVVIHHNVVTRLKSCGYAEQFTQQYLQNVSVEHGTLPVTGRYANFGVVEVGIGQVTKRRIGIRPIVAVAHAFVWKHVRTQQRAKAARNKGIATRPSLGAALGEGMDEIPAVPVGRAYHRRFGERKDRRMTMRA